MFYDRPQEYGIFRVRIALTALWCALSGLLVSCGTRPAPGPWLYVAEFDTNSITAYFPQSGGDALPFKTYSGANTQLNSPVALAIGSNKTLYVANQGSPSVTEFVLSNGGNVAPSAIISGRATGLSGPRGIAVAPNGNIFVANFTGNSVTVYAPGGSQNRAPLYTVTAGVSQPVGVAIIGNILWILNSSGAGGPTLTLYDGQGANGAQPLAILSSSAIQTPQGLATDGNGLLYVTNFDANSVAVFNAFILSTGPISVTPLTVIQGPATGLQGPESVAFDSRGDMYVANRRGSSGLGSVTVYQGFSPPNQGPPRSSTPQNLAPDATIQGPDTQLSHIVGMALG